MRHSFWLMSWLMLMSALLVAGAAEAPPKIDVPDPFGLGERLALIDWLQAQGVKPAAGATLEELTAQYLKLRKPVGADSQEHAQLADRMRRLRNELKERYDIDAPAEADEVELGRLLTDARRAVSDKAVQAVKEKASARDNPKNPEEAARFATQDKEAIRLRIESIDRDVRGDQAEIDRLAKKKEELKAEALAAHKALDVLSKRVDESKIVHNNLAKRYDQEIANANPHAVITRDEMEKARLAANALSEKFNRDLAAFNALAVADKELDVQRKRMDERLAGHDRRRQEATKQLDQIASAALSVAGAAPATGGPVEGAPALGSVQARVAAAVVLLSVENRGSGTGFFIRADGLVVTNAHVVGSRDAKILALWDASAHRQGVHMRVVQISEADDLALLKAENGAPFPVLEMAEIYDLSRSLLAAGFPLAGGVSQALQTSPSDIVMSRGALSSLRHQGERVEWIQHDCKVASGNSGGPLIDQATGAVIGINTMVISPETSNGHGDSMSFAIPVRKVRERFATLLKP